MPPSRAGTPVLMPPAPFWRSPGENGLGERSPARAAQCVAAVCRPRLVMWRHRTVRMAAKAAGGGVLVPCVGLTVTA